MTLDWDWEDDDDEDEGIFPPNSPYGDSPQNLKTFTHKDCGDFFGGNLGTKEEHHRGNTGYNGYTRYNGYQKPYTAMVSSTNARMGYNRS
jgi:hypothetical protein